MKVAEVLNKVCKSLEREPNSLTIDDTPDSVVEWDSIGHLSIISTIDSLGVSVDDEEMRTFRSLRELIDQLRSRHVVED